MRMPEAMKSFRNAMDLTRGVRFGNPVKFESFGAADQRRLSQPCRPELNSCFYLTLIGQRQSTEMAIPAGIVTFEWRDGFDKA